MADKHDERADEKGASRNTGERRDATDASEAKGGGPAADVAAAKTRVLADRSARTTAAGELSRSALQLLILALFVAGAIVAFAVPGWGLRLGVELGDGAQAALVAQDGASADAVVASVATMQRRADLLGEPGTQVRKVSDTEVQVLVPGTGDASTTAKAIGRTGNIELVRVDQIGDADALAQIQAGTTDVTLAQGTYTAFMTGDDVKGASVMEYNYNNTTYYYVTLEFTDAGAQTFADVTGELASSTGRIAVVVDGSVVSAASVNQRIEGGQVTLSGTFTRDEAYALAAVADTEPLACGFTAQDGSALEPTLGSSAALVALAALVVLVVVALLAGRAALGAGGQVLGIALAATLVLTLGALAVLAHLEVLVLGMPACAGLALSAVLSLASSASMVWRFARERRAGRSLRKAQAEATHAGLFAPARLEAPIAVAAVIAAVLVPGTVRELLAALAAGLFCDLVVSPLVRAPFLRALTAGAARPASAAPAHAKSRD